MVLNRRRATRWAVALLLGLGGAAAVDALGLWRAQRVNALISAGAAPADVDGVPPELRFALAYAEAASGAGAAALNRYGALQGESTLGQAARYNAANLLLRQGMALQASAQPGQALALVELAKEGYRDILRHDPLDWPARYNLERAQRLVPDPDEVDEEPPDVKRNAERAATTMRGFSPGLP
jgi:mxaK protein